MVARYALIALVGACASTSRDAPDRIVRGCWIDRAGAATTTLRWLPDQSQADGLVGHAVVYGEAGAEGNARYRLERRGEGWVFCVLDEADAAAGACWPVAGAPSGPLAQGRVAVQGSSEHLHITRIADDTVEDIFVGRRDGCD